MTSSAKDTHTVSLWGSVRSLFWIKKGANFLCGDDLRGQFPKDNCRGEINKSRGANLVPMSINIQSTWEATLLWWGLRERQSALLDRNICDHLLLDQVGHVLNQWDVHLQIEWLIDGFLWEMIVSVPAVLFYSQMHCIVTLIGIWRETPFHQIWFGAIHLCENELLDLDRRRVIWPFVQVVSPSWMVSNEKRSNIFEKSLRGVVYQLSMVWDEHSHRPCLYSDDSYDVIV